MPWSIAAAKRPLRRQHPAVMLLLSWIAWVRATRPAVAIHENTPGFDCDIVMDLLGDTCIIFVLKVSPAQVGFPMMSRSRLHIVCILRSARRVVRDVHDTYVELTRRLRRAMAAPSEQCKDLETSYAPFWGSWKAASVADWRVRILWYGGLLST